MFIMPNTTIKILKNVPLDNTYRNTLYFSDKTAQANFFTTKLKYNITNYSYQRQTKTLRVAILADNLFDCNYIMYQNTSYGNKWFYAFILGIEYVNNETAEITFEIDVMQTWFFDFTVNRSFVEREHSATDVIGDNLVTENLELGEYILNNPLPLEGTGLMYDYKIVMACTFDKNMNNVAGGYYGNVYSGLIYNVFDNSADANQFIEQATTENKSDGIISCFMIPSSFVVNRNEPIQDYEITFPKRHDNLDGYVPKNKKLFTHPYNFLYCTDLEGNYSEFRYEFFSGENCRFYVMGDMTCNPQAMLVPATYKNSGLNYNEKMILSGFPQCAFTTDTYKVWLAQNASSLAVNGISNAIGVAGGLTAMMLTGGLVGGGQVLSGITSTAQTLAKMNDTRSLPRQSHGASSSTLATAYLIKDFTFGKMSITAEFARIIDEFFSMYGYATHRVKVPNHNSRPQWNYIKTQNVSITGSVPADDMARLRKIYDDGITFWHNGNNVGNYSLNNSI